MFGAGNISGIFGSTIYLGTDRETSLIKPAAGYTTKKFQLLKRYRPLMLHKQLFPSWEPFRQTTLCSAEAVILFHICRQDLIPTHLFYKPAMDQESFSTQTNFRASE